MSSVHKNLSDFSHIQVASAAPYTYGIVVSQWNAEITGKLLSGAVDTLLKHGADENNINIIHVPGSFELTSGADMLISKTAVDTVICLGCVIQGETKHFDFICNAVANGITQLSIQHGVPVIFGVLTTDNLLQAQERAGGKHGNKGEEAAITAIQMAAISAGLDES